MSPVPARPEMPFREGEVITIKSTGKTQERQTWIFGDISFVRMKIKWKCLAIPTIVMYRKKAEEIRNMFDPKSHQFKTQFYKSSRNFNLLLLLFALHLINRCEEWVGLMPISPVVIQLEMGHILHRQPYTGINIPEDNSEWSVDVTGTCLDCGRKPKYLEKTHASTLRT